MNMFRLKNRSGNTMWYFAESADEAKALAVSERHAKAAANLKVVGTDADYPWRKPEDRTALLAAVKTAGAKGAGAKFIVGGYDRSWFIGGITVSY